MKNKKIVLITTILILFLLITTFAINNSITPARIASDESSPRTGQNDEYQEPETTIFSNEEFQKYSQVYNDPNVKFLRERLNSALENNEDLGIDNYREYFKSKFVVYSVEEALTGGVSIQIIFKDRPDDLFYAWVYKPVGTEDFELRGFSARELGDKELSQLLDNIQPFLSNENFAI